MENLLVILLVILIGIIIGAVWYLAKKLNKDPEKQDDQSMMMLNQSMSNFTQQTNETVNQLINQMNERLKENVQTIMQSNENINKGLFESNKAIESRLNKAAEVVGKVDSRLSQLEESNKRIYDVGKDIASLQEILRSPKLRGTHGEIFLQNLLSQVLPNEYYDLQHVFKSREIVDAVIYLKDRKMIPVDSKFPLESFQRLVATEVEEEKIRQRKEFIKQVKKHIDDIAKKYILPDEGTLDYALMYIPAENVYYEIIIKQQDDEDLLEYCHKKNVLPVSPNNLFVYLRTIMVGLKGMQIEKNAKKILGDLSRLRIDFLKFGEDFTKIGTHIAHARGAYENSEKRLNRFNDKFEDISQPVAIEGGQPELPEEQ